MTSHSPDIWIQRGWNGQSSAFNRDISRWNVSRVTKFFQMFQACKAFNIDLSLWDVSNGTSFDHMFEFAENFSQKLCWNVRGATQARMPRERWTRSNFSANAGDGRFKVLSQSRLKIWSTLRRLSSPASVRRRFFDYNLYI